ncbi:MAG: hypothetical protein V3U35_05430, partial [Candidatus Neomarinimicrobiota bacterium]
MVIRLLLLFLVLGTACEEPEPSAPFDEPLTLAFGERLKVGEEGLEVGFVAALTESRCPLEVACIWEGWAKIQLSFAEAGQDSFSLEPFIFGYVFEADTGAHRRVFSSKYTVTLLQL